MSFSVQEVLSWIDGRVVNERSLGDRLAQIQLQSSATLQASTDEDIAFFFDPNYRSELIHAAPGVLITGEQFVEPLEQAGLPLWNRSAVISSPDPYRAMSQVLEHIAERTSTVVHRDRPVKQSIHSTAMIHPSAKIGEQVEVGANCTIEAGAIIQSGVRLYPGCFIGPKVSVGEESVLFPGVIVYEQVQIGKRCRIHAGTVLGSDGFGYAPRVEGGQVREHRKLYHIGTVQIGNDVEIGALCAIDRGTIGNTVIEDHVKIDNQVQVGHNTRVAEGAVLCGQVGLSGSVRIGRFAYVGGQSGVSNKMTVGDGARIGGCSVVISDVPAGEKAWGVPSRLGQDPFRLQILFNRMLKNNKKKNPEQNQFENIDEETT